MRALLAAREARVVLVEQLELAERVVPAARVEPVEWVEWAAVRERSVRTIVIRDEHRRLPVKIVPGHAC